MFIKKKFVYDVAVIFWLETEVCDSLSCFKCYVFHANLNGEEWEVKSIDCWLL